MTSHISRIVTGNKARFLTFHLDKAQFTRSNRIVVETEVDSSEMQNLAAVADAAFG